MAALTLLVLLFAIPVAHGGCIEDFSRNLAQRLKASEKVAVSAIYDGENFYTTAYGNLLRDILVANLVRNNVKVVPRKDLMVVMEDVEAYGNGNLLGGLKAEVVVVGCYYKDTQAGRTELVLKAVRVKDRKILWASTCSMKVKSGHMRLMVRTYTNVREKTEAFASSIPLKAHLNKTCFLPGDRAQINIETRAGVYLYIFNIAADGRVSTILPNPVFPESPLSSGSLVFPPPSQKAVALVMTPYLGRSLAYESFRVVASEKRLDIEEVNTVSKLNQLLKAAHRVRWVELPYLVGEGCR